MVKLIEFDSYDDRGNYIHSLEGNGTGFTKMASNNYSTEIMDAIAALKRDPMYYYVVINALGSYEIWGANRNGDAFPRDGLKHFSLRTDMGTKEDYGYKTFEFYAHLYLHHVNKNPEKSFGKVFFSNWNPRIERVEIIVGIDRVKGQDIIDIIESGGLMAVSMGCRVPFDQCSICQHKSKTTKEYCYHLKKFMGKVATPEQARQWSLETGKTILPGASVHAWNYTPKFFDISKVFVGAEVTAYALGKVASHAGIPSAILAEVEGVTDADIDKLSALGKVSTIEKEIPGQPMNTPDGKMIDQGKLSAIRRMLDEKLRRAIAEEENIPNHTLDHMAKGFDLRTIFSTMMGMGIHPHPQEVQRIVIIQIGRPDVADFLDDRKFAFNPNADVEPADIDIGPQHFNHTAARFLMPFMLKRSCFPDYLTSRMEKAAADVSDYWGQNPNFSILSPETLLAGIASVFAAIKLKAMGMGPQQLLDTFRTQSWIPQMLGAGMAYKVLMLDRQKELDKMLVPAQNYENAFYNTYFSGHPLTKTSSVGGALALGATAGLVAVPAGYVLNAYHRKSLQETGQGLFPGSGIAPLHFAQVVGGGTALGSLLHSNYAKELADQVKKLK